MATQKARLGLPTDQWGLRLSAVVARSQAVTLQQAFSMKGFSKH
jgi:hypothetical protein